jgi:hypothetical protein
MAVLSSAAVAGGGGARIAPVRRHMDTRNNRDFGDAMIRSVFDEVSGAI